MTITGWVRQVVAAAPEILDRRDTLTRFTCHVTIAVAACSATVVWQDAAAQQPARSLGIVPQQPTEGQYVKTDQGFMVPYTETLPGSDVSFSMVPIPGGTFLMGSSPDEEDRSEDEGPQVKVVVEPFWIGQHEVAWKEYRTFMELYNVLKNREDKPEITDDNRVDAFSVPTPLYIPDYTFALGEEPDQPAVTMTQYAAKQYTKWLSTGRGRFYRLPSEAEWEYACRAGSSGAYAFGDDVDELEQYAWYYDNSDDEYHGVGQKLPNAWDLYDMHGNVGELVLDQYRKDGYAGLKPDAPATIVWPTKMFHRVIRGGSWDSDPAELRCAARTSTDDWRLEDPQLPKSPWWFADEPALRVGFRIVRPLSPPPPAEVGKYWDADVEYLQEDVESCVSEGRGVLGLPEPAK